MATIITGQYVTDNPYGGITYMTMPQSVAKGTVFTITVQTDYNWHVSIEDGGAGWMAVNPSSGGSGATVVQIKIVGTSTAYGWDNHLRFLDSTGSNRGELHISAPWEITDVVWGNITSRQLENGYLYVEWSPVSINGSSSGIVYSIELGSSILVSNITSYSAAFRPTVYDQNVAYNLVATKGSTIVKKDFIAKANGRITKPSDIVITQAQDGVIIAWTASTVVYGSGRIKQYDVIYHPVGESNQYVLQNVNSGVTITENITNGAWAFIVKAIYSYGDGTIFATEEKEFVVSAGSTIKIVINGEWVDCEVYCTVNNEWAPCEVKYCDGVNWMDL